MNTRARNGLKSLPLSTTLLLLAAAAIASPPVADNWRADDAERVVAVSDIHGAYDALVATLQQADVVDDALRWSGATTHLVIVGDILDRGPRSRDVMDLLMRLEQEAPLAGGNVLVLIGNHESMNLIGDLRYVSKEEYAAFADEETAAERDRWFLAYAARQATDPSLEGLREKFDERFPQGFFALRRAFRPDALYGRWLLAKPVIGMRNGTAFVHGGLSPAVTRLGLDGVNRDLKNEFRDYVEGISILADAGILLPTDSYYDTARILDAWVPPADATPDVLGAIATVKELADAELFDADGPLWYRGNVSCGELIEEPRVTAALQAIGANRVVVGHTPTPNRRVLQRFEGRLIEIDTGMLNAYYNGSGNALVLEGDHLAVLNQHGGAALAPLNHARNVGRRPGMMSADELQKLLEEGDIVAQEIDAAGMTVVRVSDGRHTVSAVFIPRQARGFYPGVAAYRLDRLLELEMVPVTAVREVDGRDGSLQFMPGSFVDEVQRSTSGRGGGAACSLSDQWAAMFVFDVLIFNEGRSQQRMLYDTATWNLMLIKHDRTFAPRKGRPRHLKDVALQVTEGWRIALAGLDDGVLAETFGDVLDKRRIRALAQRRDELLAFGSE